MTIPFAQMSLEHQIAPWSRLMAVTNGAYSPPLRGLYVGVSGTADLTDAEGNTTLGVTLVAGAILPAMIAGVANITNAVLYGGR